MMAVALLERPTTLEASAEAARVEVVQPLALDPDTTSPVLASIARAWHGALEAADRAALLAPVLPRLAETKGSAALEERRAVMAADWAIRCYLPNWLHRAGLEKTAAAFGALPPMMTVDDLAALLPALTDAAAEGNAAWVAARERVKAVTAPDAWNQVREDVRNAVRYIILASAEASIRVPLEDPAWARSARHVWEAAAASFWAAAWDGVLTGRGSTIDRVAAVTRNDLTAINDVIKGPNDRSRDIIGTTFGQDAADRLAGAASREGAFAKNYDDILRGSMTARRNAMETAQADPVHRPFEIGPTRDLTTTGIAATAAKVPINALLRLFQSPVDNTARDLALAKVLTVTGDERNRLLAQVLKAQNAADAGAAIGAPAERLGTTLGAISPSVLAAALRGRQQSAR